MNSQISGQLFKGSSFLGVWIVRSFNLHWDRRKFSRRLRDFHWLAGAYPCLNSICKIFSKVGVSFHLDKKPVLRRHLFDRLTCVSPGEGSFSWNSILETAGFLFLAWSWVCFWVWMACSISFIVMFLWILRSLASGICSPLLWGGFWSSREWYLLSFILFEASWLLCRNKGPSLGRGRGSAL